MFRGIYPLGSVADPLELATDVAREFVIVLAQIATTCVDQKDCDKPRRLAFSVEKGVTDSEHSPPDLRTREVIGSPAPFVIPDAGDCPNPVLFLGNPVEVARLRQDIRLGEGVVSEHRIRLYEVA